MTTTRKPADRSSSDSGIVGRIRLGLAIVPLLVSGCATPLGHGSTAGLHANHVLPAMRNPRPKTERNVEPTERFDRNGPKRWHMDFGYQISYTKLAETKRMLDSRLDKPLATDFFQVFSSPRTPLDRRSGGGLSALTIGFGRSETEWFTWTAYFIGGAGTDRHRQRWANLNLKTHFRYGSYRLGFRAEIYPVGGPRYGDDLDWRQRLSGSRPFLYLGFEGGYISAEGRGTYSVAPRTIYRDKVIVRDWILGFPIGLGLRMPLDDHWSLTLMGDYTFHAYRPQEYSGWNLLAGIRYRF